MGVLVVSDSGSKGSENGEIEGGVYVGRVVVGWVLGTEAEGEK